VAAGVGSWPFIIAQSTLLAAWTVANGVRIERFEAGQARILELLEAAASREP